MNDTYKYNKLLTNIFEQKHIYEQLLKQTTDTYKKQVLILELNVLNALIEENDLQTDYDILNGNFFGEE